MNPTNTRSHEDIAALARSGGQLAEDAMLATRRAALDGADRLALAAEEARSTAGNALHSLIDGTEDLARHGLDTLRDRSGRAREATTTFVHDKPLTALLMAAATGAAMMGLVALLTRHSGRGD